MATHDNELESILLAKAVKRFQRTPLRKMEIREESKDHLKNEHYTIKINEFKIIFHHFLDSTKGREEYILRIQTPEGKSVEYFDNRNRDYAPFLREIYKDTKKKIIESQEKQRKEEEEKFEKRLRKLKRIL